MKVADLMEDLETGDRSMEHLKKGGAEPLTSQEFRDSGFADMVNRLSGAAAGLSGGLAGASLGSLGGMSSAQNQFLNQQLYGGVRTWASTNAAGL